MPFSSLGLIPALVRAVDKAGYAVPTAIQAAAIPAILRGSDVLGAAQTGSGKTAAYALPLLGGLLADRYLGMRKAVLFGGLLLVLGQLGMAYTGDVAQGLQGQATPDAFAVQVMYFSLALIGVGVIGATLNRRRMPCSRSCTARTPAPHSPLPSMPIASTIVTTCVMPPPRRDPSTPANTKKKISGNA